MSLYCDPEEVLSHLRLLGYENISEEQLKEFIRDLKKMIKYDRKHSEYKKVESLEKGSSSYDDSYCVNSSSEASDSKTSSGDDSSSVATQSPSDNMSTCSSDYIDLPYCPEATAKKAKGLQERLPNSRLPEDKPKSYIKSWKLKQLPGTVKSDPVSLYHWYQSQWNKQKVPGEELHKRLRWSVREKMLGDDPNPRPMSQASSHLSRVSRK